MRQLLSSLSCQASNSRPWNIVLEDSDPLRPSAFTRVIGRRSHLSLRQPSASLLQSPARMTRGRKVPALPSRPPPGRSLKLHWHADRVRLADVCRGLHRRPRRSRPAVPTRLYAQNSFARARASLIAPDRPVLKTQAQLGASTPGAGLRVRASPVDLNLG